MMTAAELTGFVAAHAIWRVSEAEGLIPMLAYTTEAGQRKLERLALEDTGQAIKLGRQRLEEDPSSAVDGVLAYDGRMMINGAKLDAIILEMRSYGFPGAKAVIAVPYTPASSGRFLVHKPKLVQWEDCDDFDRDEMFAAFFQGVEAHTQGAAVWEAALDDSR